MYKVCIVDDEIINYQLFEKMVNWEEKGFSIVGTAANGLEALQMYERLQPDLIFMDIQLPLMDGLECVRCIREENHEVQIVIVSAYGDFSYAQKAIRYGVQDFLLKPVSRLILNQQVDKIKQVLDARQQPEGNTDPFSNPYTEELNRILSCLSHPAPDSRLPLHLLHELEWVCRLILRPTGDKMASIEQMKMLTAELGRMAPLSAALKMAFTASGNFVYLGFHDTSAFQDILESILAFFKNKGYAAEIYPWQKGTGSLSLADFLNHTAMMDNYGFYEKDGGIYSLSDYPFSDQELNVNALDSIIVESLAKNNPQKLLDYLAEIFELARKEKLAPVLLKNHALDVLVKIKFVLKKFDSRESFFIMRNIRLEKLQQTISQPLLWEFVTCRIDGTFKEVNQILLQADKGRNLVFQANSFADLYYADSGFSVQMAADFIGMSKNYFTSLYKENSGLGYWDYVTRLRMEKAQELLITTNETMGSIARQIGYESEYHFSRKFKEYTGQSPNHYRKHS